MIAMGDVDVQRVLGLWFSEWEPQWKSHSIGAELRLPDGAGLNKAVVTLQTPTHVASATAWGAGTLEWIVLELPTKRDVVIADEQFKTEDELRGLLDACANSFVALISARPTIG
jgi:hypothetical protein